MSVNILTQNGLQRIHTARVLKDYRVINVTESDVNFYDYDGTLIDAYAKTEFLALSALPPNPTHEGLIAQGWNWNLNDAKDYVRDYGKLNIGQTYTTSDGKTRIYIHLEEGRLSPQLGLGINGSVDVDWGDGTAHGTFTGSSISTLVTIPHTYTRGGDYVITLTAAEDTTIAILGSNQTYDSLLLTKNGTANNESQVYRTSLKKVLLGNGITNIGNFAFHNCYSLTSITIPDSVANIGNGAFAECTSLTSLIIPNSVTSIGNYAFEDCTNLTSITTSNSITSIGDRTFHSCSSLIGIAIPNSVTNIGSGAFKYCTSLTSITIPNGVTDIGYETFYNCTSLTSITIPNSVTSIGDEAFRYCISLTIITIPNSVTNIGSGAFNECVSLTSLTIPNNITNIEYGAFEFCYGLGFIRFESITPPVVSESAVFNEIPIDCIIYVPQGTLSVYTSAQYYPNPNTYTYIEYQE